MLQIRNNNLRWLYNGEQKAKGRPRQYAGKVCFEDLSRFDLAENVDGQRVYTAIVNSPTFKCMLRIVYVVREEKGKIYTALLFSTDTDCAALDILRYYRARFQIEFLFRDAKQHTGLCDCQATSEAKLGFHFNVSLRLRKPRPVGVEHYGCAYEFFRCCSFILS